jgi:MFS family permease
MLVLTVTRSLMMFSMSMALPYFSLYIRALGGQPTDIGYVRMVRSIAVFIMFPIAGYLTDQMGRVKMIVTAGYLASMIYLIFIFANDWRYIALASFLLGLVTIHFPALGAIMADSIPPRQRGIGYAVSLTIPGAISILSPYIGGYLVDSLGVSAAIRWIYTLMLVMWVTTATIRLKFLKETMVRPLTSVSLSNIPQIMKDSYRSAFGALKWMPRSLWALTLIMVFIYLANSVAGPFWVIYAVEVIGLTATQWGLLGLVGTVLRTLLGVPAGILVDRASKKLIIITCLASSLLPLYYFVHSKTFIQVLIVTIIISTVNAFLVASFQSMMADSVPRERRGRIMAAIGRGFLMITGAGWSGEGGGPGMSLILSVPTIVGSLAGGYIYSANVVLPWMLMTGAFAASTAIGIVFVKDPAEKEL